MICLYTRQLNPLREDRLSFLHLKDTVVTIFPQAQWTERASKTDNDYVICINIMRRIKSRIRSAQLSYFKSLTYKARALIFLLCACVDANYTKRFLFIFVPQTLQENMNFNYRKTFFNFSPRHNQRRILAFLDSYLLKLT